MTPKRLFSERIGLKKTRTEFQVESIDDALRNRLWNVLKVCYWDTVSIIFSPSRIDFLPSPMRTLLTRIWHNYFKQPLDAMPSSWNEVYKYIREYFFNCPWHEVYSFLEFVADNYPNKETNKDFKRMCNSVLEEEMSAYRFVGDKIVRITSDEEISEIEEALETPFKNVNIHIERALTLMSDRKSPDYRNSIKEAISAVEAVCRIVAKDEKATLGKALDAIEGEIDLHSALKRAFDSLYGYTSSAEGIRHALLDENVHLDLEDAKFMLVSCSAFINYLISKASKAGILLT